MTRARLISVRNGSGSGSAALMIDSSPGAIFPTRRIPFFEHQGKEVGNNLIVFRDQDAGYRHHAFSGNKGVMTGID
jgi:hypothetical protein